jgi:hypothetical protein
VILRYVVRFKFVDVSKEYTASIIRVSIDQVRNKQYSVGCCFSVVVPLCSKLKTVRPSEISVNFYQTTWRHIIEEASLQVEDVKCTMFLQIIFKFVALS